MRDRNPIRRLFPLLLCILMTAALLLPVLAQESGKTVRVGWYESPFNYMDQFGRRAGYAYEFQQKIAAYTGWRYEYVEGSWSELMQMLIDGEIDLMSDVSYTQERTQWMLFPSSPMGTQEYYLFVSNTNTEYSSDTFGWLNGKRVGVNKGAVQAGFFNQWQEANGVQADVVELTCTEIESIQMLEQGELDAYVSVDSYGDIDNSVIPVVKVGASDFFFAVSLQRPDLLEELNSALGKIQEENRFYAQQLFMKSISTVGANLFLTADEKEWLTDHGPIRVGYQDNYLSFCDADEDTGKLTGALKDYLEHASDCLENAQLDFQPLAYPTAAAAMEALQKGEVDCMFPSNLSVSQCEARGMITTPSVMSAEVYAVVRKADQNAFSGKEQVVTAVVEGNPNVAAVVMDHFPDWETETYPDLKACFQAVAQGKADCTLVSNYQYNSVAKLCEKYNLTPVHTGKPVQYSFTVNRDSRELYAILTRTSNLVNETAISSALSYYASEEARTTLLDLILEHPGAVVAIGAVILSMLAVILAQRRIIQAEHEVENLNQRVFVDALTQVRNKAAFYDYTGQMQERMDRGEQLAFAVCVFDCDNLKLINDQYGHEKGDVYIQTAAKLICKTFQHSPVFRIGGDEFTSVLVGEDYQRREELLELFQRDRSQTESARERWTQAGVTMGMAVYDPRQDTSVNDTIRRADAVMYENKKKRKTARK